MPQFGRASTGVVGAVVAATIVVGTVIAATVIGATFIVLLTVRSAATQTAPRVWLATASTPATAPHTAHSNRADLNGTTEINAQGPGGSVVPAQSMSNVTGLGVGVGGGNTTSYRNNQLTGNVTEGARNGFLTRR
jgi:hypothetical protein